MKNGMVVSLDAIVQKLEKYDLTLRLDFGPAYSAQIIPEGRRDEPQPTFSRNNTEVYNETHEHPTMSELVALVFIDWLNWMNS